MIRDAAFLIGIIDIESGQLLGVDIFLEEFPWMAGGHCTFVIARGRGQNFQEGVEDLQRMLDAAVRDENERLCWPLRFISDQARKLLKLSYIGDGRYGEVRSLR